MSTTSVILLTYKGKILLMVNNYRSPNSPQNIWGMVESRKRLSESFLDAIVRKTKEEMKIQLRNVSFLFKVEFSDGVVYFSHGKLTDDDVNCIERREGHEIWFFAPSEILKLQLAPFTDSFFAEYKSKLANLLN